MRRVDDASWPASARAGRVCIDGVIVEKDELHTDPVPFEYSAECGDTWTEWHDEKGQLHREDGPAVEYGGCRKEWYCHGKCHRIDGPSVEDTRPDSSGRKIQGWYINGSKIEDDELCDHLKRLIKIEMRAIYYIAVRRWPFAADMYHKWRQEYADLVEEGYRCGVYRRTEEDNR